MTITVNDFVGIKDLSNIGISIYPNPSTGIFTIGTLETYNITIFDVSGKVISQFNDVADKFNIDISAQANGIYFIKFQNNETVKTVKIIKE